MEFTDQELAAIRAEQCKGASDNQFTLFISECKSRALRPGTHILFQLRKAKEYDPVTGAYISFMKPFYITTISALLLIAERTGKYDGASAPEYIYLDDAGEPTVLSEIPLPDKEKKSLPREPWAVRVKVRRKDFSEPISSIVRFESVAGTRRVEGGGVALTEMWQKRGPEQNAKCSLAAAIRICFPEEAGQLFIAEELKNEPEDAPTPSQALTPAPSAPIVPKVDQTPATSTDAPRPGEEKPIPTLVELILDKPAAPEPERKKPGRPKKEPVPDNGNPGELGITDEDIALAGPSTTETPEERAAALADAHAFVEEVSVVATDPLPTKEQKDAFVAHVREIVAAGVDNKLLGAYICGRVNKQKSSELTVGEWKSAFEILNSAKAAGTLKEVVKPV